MGPERMPVTIRSKPKNCAYSVSSSGPLASSSTHHAGSSLAPPVAVVPTPYGYRVAAGLGVRHGIGSNAGRCSGRPMANP